MDFLFDTTSDGRPFKVLSMCDEFIRESVGGKAARSITDDDVADILDLVTVRRGAPRYIRCDNGPEFIAAAIRDWRCLSGTGAACIDPGPPWQNPSVESFNSRAGDELFAGEIFHSIMEARILYDGWRYDYNTYRPHSA
jgi:transposase InsO family protein